MRSTGLKRFAFTLVLSGFCSAALAQYVWLDEKGVKQYSDMPPPASVPNSRMLKSPGAMPQTAPAAATDSDEKSADTATSKAPPTLADKNADFQKRRAEQAEKDKLAADKAKQDASKKKNCEQVSNYQRALQSGQRITRLSPTGERIFLTDEERAATVRENQRTLSDCK
ncbi:MAG TPA: DUF4124 domain-containing protein [Oxalicibacterium sp.]|uniref:DUF4124 domain-containing protein n=1 Tax=Oxalicibacterium sp. TaxID=2766525 RepID=UPI002C257A28|nr:DUF4124 domain-containing protein [Oxalicibacterium sp.]HWU99134.1 DUF4124 domain-containing protein [Oxalicibacterium sp.]